MGLSELLKNANRGRTASVKVGKVVKIRVLTDFHDFLLSGSLRGAVSEQFLFALRISE